MECPKCGCKKNVVVDSRKQERFTFRRRECSQCGFRFNTYESRVMPALKVENTHSAGQANEHGARERINHGTDS